jgi:hypothetical protein
MTVYKYKLSRNQATLVELPLGAEALTIAVQCGDIYLWALVDPTQPNETRTFEVYGTGHNMPNYTRKFINTFFVNNGEYVFHAFEQCPKELMP